MKIVNRYTFLLVIMLILSTPITSNAGTWQNGEESNQNKCWYDNGDGTYANNGWYWIAGHNDQIEECYYFDEDGWLLTDTVTPDGYKVNTSGQWLVNEEVKVTDNSNSKTENSDKKSESLIKNVAVSEIGRPFSSTFPDAASSKWRLATIKDLSDKPTTLVPTFIYNDKGYLVEKYDLSTSEEYNILAGKTVKRERKYFWWFYGYDSNGKLIRQWQLKPEFEGVPTDKESHWSYEYNSNGLLTKKINHAHDLAGNQYIHVETSYYYDNNNRLIKEVNKNTRITPSGEPTFNYVANGEMEIIEFEYNDYDKTIKSYLTSDGKSSSGSQAGTILIQTYKADEKGNIIEIASSSGAVKSFYNYDDDGRLIKSFSTGVQGDIHSERQYIYE